MKNDPLKIPLDNIEVIIPSGCGDATIKLKNSMNTFYSYPVFVVSCSLITIDADLKSIIANNPK